MHSLLMICRHLFCTALAIALITSGRVRRAKKRILKSNVVTAIYFHNPNERLFTKCVTWLIKNGYTFISDQHLIEILHRGLEPPKRAVWLSFDDGFQELRRNVIPLILQKNIPITLFIPSDIIAGNGLFPWLHQTTHGMNCSSTQKPVRDSLTVADVQEISKYPEMSIGSHTAGHIVTSNLSAEQARFEFYESKRVIENWTGHIVTSFAYPEGRFSGSEAGLLAECGYLLAATTEPMFVTRESNPYFLPRLHVGDNIPFPEAICNMVGVWRPAIDTIIHICRRWTNRIDGLRYGLRNGRNTSRGIVA